MLLRSLLAIAILSGVAAGQVRPPQPDYAAYGSYSRQMTVYENAKRREDALELEKYRKFREEVKRQTVVPQYTVIVSSRIPTACNAERSWQQNRCCGRR